MPTLGGRSQDDPDPTPPESSATQWDALAEKAGAEVLGDVAVLSVVEGEDPDE